MGKRVFVGIPAGDGVVKPAREWRQKNTGLPVRWLKENNLHLTLVPPFESSDTEAVAKKLATVRFSAFRLEFRKAGPGPDFGAPWFIRAESAPTGDLLDLRKCIFAALKQEPGGRVFYPHITLARFLPGESLNMGKKDATKNILWSMRVEKFVLYESILGREGSEYKILAGFSSR